jgi:hypothetical protein
MLYILAMSRVNMDCRLKNSEKPGYDGIGGWTASELMEIRLLQTGHMRHRWAWHDWRECTTHNQGPVSVASRAVWSRCRAHPPGNQLISRHNDAKSSVSRSGVFHCFFCVKMAIKNLVPWWISKSALTEGTRLLGGTFVALESCVFPRF